MRSSAPSLAVVERLAIVCPSWVGDCVMATPVYRAMRQAIPRARISGIVRPGLQDVLSGLTWFDELIACEMKGALGPLRLARALKGADAVFLLPNSSRAALAARISRSRIRIGYNRDGRGWLLTHKLDPPTSKAPISAVEYYASLASFALQISENQIDRHIELAITAAQHAAADDALRDVGPDFILLNPGANRADKRWPAESFAQAADALASEHALSVVVNGSPKEREVIDRLIDSAKTPIIDLSNRGRGGGGGLGVLKAVIARAKLVITNDTGPRHIAAALGTPVVTLFGPTDHRWTTLHGVRERILLAEPFLPEELMADRHRKACSIEKISVRDVVIAAQGLLARSPSREVASAKA